MIIFLINTFIILHILKKLVLHVHRILYHNSLILFLTSLTHYNLCNDFMDSMCEFPIFVKSFETKWEALYRNK